MMDLRTSFRNFCSGISVEFDFYPALSYLLAMTRHIYKPSKVQLTEFGRNFIEEVNGQFRLKKDRSIYKRIIRINEFGSCEIDEISYIFYPPTIIQNFLINCFTETFEICAVAKKPQFSKYDKLLSNMLTKKIREKLKKEFPDEVVRFLYQHSPLFNVKKLYGSEFLTQLNKLCQINLEDFNLEFGYSFRSHEELFVAVQQSRKVNASLLCCFEIYGKSIKQGIVVISKYPMQLWSMIINDAIVNPNFFGNRKLFFQILDMATNHCYIKSRADWELLSVYIKLVILLSNQEDDSWRKYYFLHGQKTRICDKLKSYSVIKQNLPVNATINDVLSFLREMVVFFQEVKEFTNVKSFKHLVKLHHRVNGKLTKVVTKKIQDAGIEKVPLQAKLVDVVIDDVKIEQLNYVGEFVHDGIVQGHCLATYVGTAAKRQNIRFFKIVSDDGVSHAEIEFSENSHEVVQHFAAKNRPPADANVAALDKWLKSLKKSDYEKLYYEKVPVDSQVIDIAKEISVNRGELVELAIQ